MTGYLFAVVFSVLLVLHAKKKKSLSYDGRVAAFILGLVTFSSDLYVFTTVLLGFFLASSRLTKFKAEKKRLLEEDYEASSERNWVQVMCNGLMGGLAVAFFRPFEPMQCYRQNSFSTLLMWAYIGHYGCCAGDTWASELGILNNGWPILITTFKKVPPGTNGGVSQLGLFASLAGGAWIGLIGALTLWAEQSCGGFPWEILVVGSLSGIIGSLIDSLLGATVQESVYSKEKKIIISQKSTSASFEVVSGIPLLDNHQVNLLSSMLTSSLCAFSAWCLYSAQQ
ncbi:integral membrane protein DUF92-domain-containing protein [Sporodiniella umbellata]|nr:integral membrane protein DUF92-domain-containing protein [Sporodiniella umbellata]